MSFTIPAGALLGEKFKIDGTDPVVVLAADRGRTIVKRLRCTEIAGSTPAVTIDVLRDGVSYYLRKAAPMTANGFLQEEDIVLQSGDQLRVMASSANQVDVFVDWFPPDATAKDSIRIA